MQVGEPQELLSSLSRLFTLIWSSSLRVTPAVCQQIYTTEHSVRGGMGGGVGGQIVMVDYTRDIMSFSVCVCIRVCVGSCPLPLNHKHAFFAQLDSHGKPNQRLSFKHPAFRFLDDRLQRQYEVCIWCLSIISWGKDWFTFAGGCSNWFACINSCTFLRHVLLYLHFILRNTFFLHHCIMSATPSTSNVAPYLIGIRFSYHRCWLASI